MKSYLDYNQAFTEMVTRHKKIIFSVCFFYATTDVEVDDLRQEVLISLFNAYRNFRSESKESTWVYRVALNTCLFALRRFSPKVKTISLDEITSANIEDDSDSEWRLKLEWLHSSISQLDPIDKAIILMWLDDFSYDEIASAMGIPRNTVASRLHRIKVKLSTKIR